MDTQKNFFEMYGKFRHLPSKRFARPTAFCFLHTLLSNTPAWVLAVMRDHVSRKVVSAVWRKVTDILPLLSRDPRYHIPIAVVRKQEASCITTWAVHSSRRIWKLILQSCVRLSEDGPAGAEAKCRLTWDLLMPSYCDHRLSLDGGFLGRVTS
jgi:hypothetical protein